MSQENRGKHTLMDYNVESRYNFYLYLWLYAIPNATIKTSLFVAFSYMICKVFKTTSDKGFADLDFLQF